MERRVFRTVRRNSSSSQNYDTVCKETEHLVESDSTTKVNQSKQSKRSSSPARRKLSLVNRQKDNQANSGKTGKPSDKAGRPSSQTGKPSGKTEKPSEKTGNPSGRTEKPSDKNKSGRPSDKAGIPSDKAGIPSDKAGKPPRPPAPNSTNNRTTRRPNHDRPKTERPDSPVNAAGRGPTDGPPKQIGEMSRPPKSAPQTKVSRLFLPLSVIVRQKYLNFLLI